MPSPAIQLLKDMTGPPGSRRCAVVRARLHQVCATPLAETVLAAVSAYVAVRIKAALVDLGRALEDPRGVDAGGHVVFAEDAVAARMVAFTGSSGAGRAQPMLDRAARRRAEASGLRAGPSPMIFDPSVDPPRCRLVEVLAEVVYEDLVRPFADASGREVPALTGVVMDATRRAHWAPGVEASPDGRLLDSAGEEVAFLSSPIGLDVLKSTRSVVGHRLLRYLVCEGHRRVAEDEPDARRLEFVGGYEELANRLDYKGRGSAATLRRVLDAFDAVRFRGPGWEGGLLRTFERQECRGRPALLVVTLCEPLLPGYVHDLPKGPDLATRHGRHLIPVPRELPPLVGRGNERGAQCVLQLLGLMEFRRHARQYVREGAVRISANRWWELATDAGLPPKLVPAVLESWASGTEDAPPFLRGLGDDHFDLAASYGPVRALLLAGGRQAEQAGEAGRKAAVSRAQGSRSRRGRWRG